MKHAGSCLCGEVRFEVDGAFDAFFLCHCAYCRKDTGSAHAANLFASGAGLRWLSGEASVSQFRLPATRHARSFCARCGSALPSLQKDGELLVVPAGSLDSEVPIKPQGHLFVSSKASWDDRLESLCAYDTLPGP